MVVAHGKVVEATRLARLASRAAASRVAEAMICSYGLIACWLRTFE